MFRKLTFAVLIVLGINTFSSYARTLDVSLRIRNDKSDEKIINLENLLTIRKFIIKNNLRQGYGNMYSENFAYHTKRFSFYLDPGSFGNTLDGMKVSEFQGIVIFDPNRTKWNCRIEFPDEFIINVRLFGSTDFLTLSQIREFASKAIQEILAEINKGTSASKPQPKITTDTGNLQEAINLAIPALYKDKMTQSFNSKLYVLTSAQQFILNNKWIWRVTFKSKELLPDDLSKGFIGFGGEVFVNVDLKTKETVITYGE